MILGHEAPVEDTITRICVILRESYRCSVD